MSSAVATAWFGSLFILAIVWLGLIVWLFRRLRLRHPATYEAMGSPSLFWNNSMRNNWLLLKFLFGGQWRALGDARLSAVIRGMRVLLIVSLAGFAAFLAAFMALGVKPA
jgi:hypothetical protein